MATPPAAPLAIRLGMLGRPVLSGAMVVTGLLLVVAMWHIPYALEILIAAVLLHAGLVLAGCLPGPRRGSGLLLVVGLATALMVPSSDALWTVVERALHVAVGIALLAGGVAAAVPTASSGRATAV